MVIFAPMFEHTHKFIAFQPAEKNLIENARVIKGILISAILNTNMVTPNFFAFSYRIWIKECLCKIWAKSYRFWKFIETAAPPPPSWFEFWSFWTFLHHGIEVERHLLWKFHKKIQRKSWSNVSPNLLICIGFLYKVVHKNGRLRKFNGAREI